MTLAEFLKASEISLLGWGGIKKLKRSSNGNLVNVGNFDENGVKVNNDNPRNRNDNLGACFSRSVNSRAPYSFGALLYYVA